MRDVFDTALAVTKVEERAMELKKLLCNGSMLKGFTPKLIGDIDQRAVESATLRLWRAQNDLADLVMA